MTIAVCPGSFDPITLGHVDVIRRARGLFDEVVVAVGANPAKRYLFSAEERCALASEALAEIPGVRVQLLPGLIAEYCRDIGAVAIIKGLRGAADYDGEQAMALMNRHLTGIETVFIMGDTNLGHVASSLVKDVACHGGDISGLVPENVAEALVKRVRQNGEN
ncbi:MAG: pantetheine-phosphate adenylyltransferase [Actinomycetaceae bacterium]|nr:pantetheine-phosphate adenylyltransferase [Actinomycetaceae bacterium]